MSDTYTVSRATTIDASADAVYERIVDLHRWTEWSPWEGLDPELHRDYSGAGSGVGARYAWSGNRKAGKGEMEILRADEPGRVDIKVVFQKPMKSTSTSVFELTPEGDRTGVTWTMTGPHSLFSRVAAPLGFFDKLLGKDFEKGLAKLKAVSEN
ncbi:SRPBCC family protein [Gordonia sp. ABSL49_1]|uniref:SRPBCC family protein n=1 Tax=Gordonia sp. ABSL49_1 TaxID=2920941 RepID=UPI001F0E2B9D|nr:SRPBCC family protein [Gordonia sp. ABSL49_1]MCH5641843.1 SRPBCC family protein [Gordonia sp. ABSL49_1]